MNSDVSILKEAFKRIYSEQVDLMIEKYEGYGKDNVLEAGEAGIASRLNDKVKRLINLLSKGVDSNGDESLDDTWRDFIGWASLGLLLHRRAYVSQENFKTQGKHSPSPPLIYLAAPIDLSDANEDRAKAKHALCTRGARVFDPAGAFSWGGGYVGGHKLVNINEHALGACDGVLFLYSGKPTVGTIMEMQKAIDMGIPTAVISSDTRSIYLHRLPVYSDLMEGVDSLMAACRDRVR